MSPYIYFSHLINQYGQANKPQGYRFPHYSEFATIAAFVALYAVIQYTIIALGQIFYEPIVKSQENAELKQKYIHKASEATAKGLLYGIHFFWGCQILYKTNWMGWYHGGSGDFSNQIKNMPFTEVPYEIHLFCLSITGYFTFQLIDVAIYGKGRIDYNEMITHHVATVLCTMGMIFANSEPVGAVICWQQTWCDLSVCLLRIMTCTNWRKTSFAAYLVMMILWFYSRIGTLGYSIYLMATKMKYPAQIAYFDFHVNMYVFFAIILYIMQIYWTVLLLAMGKVYIRDGKTVDLSYQIKETKKAK